MFKKAIVIGAGPAGLTAAWELLKKGIKPVIVEAANQYVGGLSRTEIFKENYIDIGGHRFFSKSKKVMNWWAEFMPTQDNLGEKPKMLVKSRLSRIFYLRKFFNYPITLNWQTIKNLGIKKIVKIGFSYLMTKFSKNQENSLEDFFINRFGKELYKTFFKDYTEKVWGKACNEISPEWGKQRIKQLSLAKTILNAVISIFRTRNINQKNVETSLIDTFLYPPHGPGQFWTLVAEKIKEQGGEILMGQTVNKLYFENGKIKSVGTITKEGLKDELAGDCYFSSMPIKDLINSIDGVPPDVKIISQNLEYRDFITVGLLVNEFEYNKEKIRDNWLYIQEPDVKIGRIQIFNNWSEEMVKDKTKIWISLEYFVYENDELWKKTDSEITNYAVSEMIKIGLLKKENVVDSSVVRVPKAYPAYFGAYKNFQTIKDYTDKIPNLFLIGRNGTHRYNNMDHSMLCAMTAVECACGEKNKQEIWQVNAEQEYLEEKEKEHKLYKLIKKFKLELAVFFLFAFSTFVINLFHEPWIDEAQAWNLSTSNNLFQIIQAMPYEGSPALWHFLLHFLGKLGLDFQHLFIFHWLLSLIAVGLLLFLSPLPRWFKLSLPFTYFLFFEYNAISRSYVLTVLFLFILAFLDKHKLDKYPLYIFFLFLLSQTNFHGFLLSLVLGLFLIWDAEKNKKRLLTMITASVMIMISFLTFLQVAPSTDSAKNLPWLTPKLLSLASLSINNAFCPISDWSVGSWGGQLINDYYITSVTENNNLPLAFGTYFVFSLILLILSFLPFIRNNRVFLIYFTGVFVLESLFYLISPGSLRHHGLIFIFFLYCLWLTYSEKKDSKINNEKHLTYLLGTLIFFQLTATLITGINEIRYNFSGEKAAVQYLKENDYLKDDYLLIPFHVNSNPVMSALVSKKIFYCLEYDKYCNYGEWNKTYETSLKWKVPDLIQKVDTLSQNNKDKQIILLLFRKLENPEFRKKFILEKSFDSNLFSEGNIYIYRYVHTSQK